MSTNNNLLGKEKRPQWNSEENETSRIQKLDGDRLQLLLSNQLSEVTALSLANRGLEKIENLNGLGSNVRRLDLSHNCLQRLNGFSKVNNISMMNISSNNFTGDSGLEELRYLSELRTLNIGFNAKINHIRPHVVKPLERLQALIANDCNLEGVAFLKVLPTLNTLVLSRNILSSFSVADTGSMALLTKLSLGHNKLTEIPNLSQCALLQELRVNHNVIEVIDESILVNKKIKILDLSHNLISSWDSVHLLPQLTLLTNLCVHGNPLPTPPAITTTLREDISAGNIVDEDAKLYRQYVLNLFQHTLGKLNKLHIQLVVLDMKRVKVKWTQGGAGLKGDDVTISNEDAVPVNSNKAMKKMIRDFQQAKDTLTKSPPGGNKGGNKGNRNSSAGGRGGAKNENKKEGQLQAKKRPSSASYAENFKKNKPNARLGSEASSGKASNEPNAVGPTEQSAKPSGVAKNRGNKPRKNETEKSAKVNDKQSSVLGGREDKDKLNKLANGEPTHAVKERDDLPRDMSGVVQRKEVNVSNKPKSASAFASLWKTADNASNLGVGGDSAWD